MAHSAQINVNGVLTTVTEFDNSAQAIDDAVNVLGAPTTPQAALSALGAGVRPNLLDNAYFVGGGSQKGGGVFPINQKGQTSYTGVGYGIDRWYGGYGSPTITLGDEFITLDPSENYESSFCQMLETDFRSKTLTFSLLASSQSGDVGINLHLGYRLSGGYKRFTKTHYISTSASLITVTGEIPSNADPNSEFVRFYFVNDGSAAPINIYAAKLEEAPNQTLAYQDSTGAWHRLPQPEDGDYAGQLLKCQQYLVPLPLTGADNYAPIGFGYSYSANSVRIFIPTPVQMRDDPVIQYVSGDISGFSILCNGTVYTPTAVSHISALSGGVAIAFTVSGITGGYPCVLRTQSAYAMLSAPL